MNFLKIITSINFHDITIGGRVKQCIWIENPRFNWIVDTQDKSLIGFPSNICSLMCTIIFCQCLTIFMRYPFRLQLQQFKFAMLNLYLLCLVLDLPLLEFLSNVLFRDYVCRTKGGALLVFFWWISLLKIKSWASSHFICVLHGELFIAIIVTFNLSSRENKRIMAWILPSKLMHI